MRIFATDKSESALGRIQMELLKKLKHEWNASSPSFIELKYIIFVLNKFCFNMLSDLLISNDSLR